MDDELAASLVLYKKARLGRVTTAQLAVKGIQTWHLDKVELDYRKTYALLRRYLGKTMRRSFLIGS
jgi:hypothetical protein